MRIQLLPILAKGGCQPSQLFIGRFREPRYECPTLPRTTLRHRAGYQQNHCGAVLVGGGYPSMGVVCGSDNHMFGRRHNQDRMISPAISTIEGQGTQSD